MGKNIMKLPIEIGDLLLRGKWRNQKEIVKKFGYNKDGQPTINGRTILNFRIAKTYDKAKQDQDAAIDNMIDMNENTLKGFIKEGFIEESDASDAAKKKGLKHVGFGNYANKADHGRTGPFMGGHDNKYSGF